MESGVSQLKVLYGYVEKTTKVLESIADYLEKKIREIKELPEDDESNKFLKELAKTDLQQLYFFIKNEIEVINTPVRSTKRGFKKVFNERIEEMINIVSEVENRLKSIVKKLENFQEKLFSKRTGYIPFREFIRSYRDEIHDNLKLAASRILHDKLEYFNEELDKIKELKEPHQITNFLKVFESNVNTFITQQLLENTAAVVNSLKDTMLKKTEEYLNQLDIPQEKKKQILEKVELFLDSYDNLYPVIYFDLPDIPPDFFDYKGEYKSRLDVFVENIMSGRFLVIFGIGFVLSLIGLLEAYSSDSDIAYIILFIGIILIIFSIIDAMFFNNKFLEDFLEIKKNQLLNIIKQKLNEIQTNTTIFLLEQEENLETSINEIINAELEAYSKGGQYLEDLKNMLNTFITSLEELKKDLMKVKES